LQLLVRWHRCTATTDIHDTTTARSSRLSHRHPLWSPVTLAPLRRYQCSCAEPWRLRPGARISSPCYRRWASRDRESRSLSRGRCRSRRKVKMRGALLSASAFAVTLFVSACVPAVTAGKHAGVTPLWEVRFEL